jgi:hypothetical protein
LRRRLSIAGEHSGAAVPVAFLAVDQERRAVKDAARGMS